jgi:hypothetical protein
MSAFAVADPAINGDNEPTEWHCANGDDIYEQPESAIAQALALPAHERRLKLLAELDLIFALDLSDETLETLLHERDPKCERYLEPENTQWFFNEDASQHFLNQRKIARTFFLTLHFASKVDRHMTNISVQSFRGRSTHSARD